MTPLTTQSSGPDGSGTLPGRGAGIKSGLGRLRRRHGQEESPRPAGGERGRRAGTRLRAAHVGDPGPTALGARTHPAWPGRTSTDPFAATACVGSRGRGHPHPDRRRRDRRPAGVRCRGDADDGGTRRCHHGAGHATVDRAIAAVVGATDHDLHVDDAAEPTRRRTAVFDPRQRQRAADVEARQKLT